MDIQIADRTTALSDVTRAVARIAAARTLEDAIDLVRSSARSLIGADGIAVIRLDGDLCHYVEEDAIGKLWKGHKFPVSACISGWSMLNRQTVVVPDVMMDDRIPYELYEGTFARAVAMAPVCPAKPIGAIGAYWARPYSPEQTEIDILEALADAVATAVDNIVLIPRRDNQSIGLERETFEQDIAAVNDIAAVPAILDIALRMTGMGFAAVARVTDSRWITCTALDHVSFGLKAGDELPVQSTICDEIRGHRSPVVIDNVADDPDFRDHHTPKAYGLQSYISVPIILADGRFFGTLCAIDPKPAKVNNPLVLGTFKLFAELIGQHLDAADRLKNAEATLLQEQELSELREQFIAVLGHDLRNPIAAIDAGTSRLLRDGWTARSPVVLQLMKASISRMAGLVENVMDLARARMGGGITIEKQAYDLAATVNHVVDELHTVHPDRLLQVELALPDLIAVDPLRMSQMFSNLIANAITHGSEHLPIRIVGRIDQGHVEVCVINSGTPIPPAQIEKLFQPFRRGELKSSMQGLGLGLYIASEIASAHGGSITVRSDRDETCFTFRMPLAV